MASYEKWEQKHLWEEVIRRKIPRFEGDNRGRLITLLKLDDEHRQQRNWIFSLGFLNALGWGLLWALSLGSNLAAALPYVGIALFVVNGAMWMLAAVSMERFRKLTESAASDST